MRATDRSSASPHLMAALVVDLLELVDIDKHQRKRQPIGHASLYLTLEVLLKMGVIGQAGQRIAHDKIASRDFDVRCGDPREQRHVLFVLGREAVSLCVCGADDTEHDVPSDKRNADEGAEFLLLTRTRRIA